MWHYQCSSVASDFLFPCPGVSAQVDGWMAVGDDDIYFLFAPTAYEEFEYGCLNTVLTIKKTLLENLWHSLNSIKWSSSKNGSQSSQASSAPSSVGPLPKCMSTNSTCKRVGSFGKFALHIEWLWIRQIIIFVCITTTHLDLSVIVQGLQFRSDHF